MIIPDVNLLLYAEVAAFPEHARARRWWERVLGSDEEVGLALPALFGFVRLATSARVLAPPLSVENALGRVERWLEQPNVRVLVPGRRHLGLAFGLLREIGTAANLTTDAQLAALALESGGTVCSNDSDFARFSGLDWQNPLDAH